jgi:hypothetical protein
VDAGLAKVARLDAHRAFHILDIDTVDPVSRSWYNLNVHFVFSKRGFKMTALTLTSSHQHPLRPLVEAAIQNELRLLEAGIRRTEERLQDFEEKHNLTTQEFLRRYENDEVSETLEFAEWIGEYHLLKRLREKAETLQEIRFAN